MFVFGAAKLISAAEIGLLLASLAAVYGRLSIGKGLHELEATGWRGLYPTYSCGLSSAPGHNAIRAAQLPIESWQLRCTAPVGSLDPAVSTGHVN